jgi:hypothetical protein
MLSTLLLRILCLLSLCPLICTFGRHFTISLYL